MSPLSSSWARTSSSSISGRWTSSSSSPQRCLDPSSVRSAWWGSARSRTAAAAPSRSRCPGSRRPAAAAGGRSRRVEGVDPGVDEEVGDRHDRVALVDEPGHQDVGLAEVGALHVVGRGRPQTPSARRARGRAGPRRRWGSRSAARTGSRSRRPGRPGPRSASRRSSRTRRWGGSARSAPGGDGVPLCWASPAAGRGRGRDRRAPAGGRGPRHLGDQHPVAAALGGATERVLVGDVVADDQRAAAGEAGLEPGDGASLVDAAGTQLEHLVALEDVKPGASSSVAVEHLADRGGCRWPPRQRHRDGGARRARPACARRASRLGVQVRAELRSTSSRVRPPPRRRSGGSCSCSR
jgi:hypothetical protein